MKRTRRSSWRENSAKMMEATVQVRATDSVVKAGEKLEYFSQSQNLTDRGVTE
jgi:hypothetical protein